MALETHSVFSLEVNLSNIITNSRLCKMFVPQSVLLATHWNRMEHL